MRQAQPSSNTQIGQRAERVAADYLERLGYQIIDRNFSIPGLCEIDIVAAKDGCVYFVEVKYRSSQNSGGGLDYITPGKLQHMTRAAQIWVRHHSYAGDYNLAAIEIAGADLSVGRFVDVIY